MMAHYKWYLDSHPSSSNKRELDPVRHIFLGPCMLFVSLYLFLKVSVIFSVIVVCPGICARFLKVYYDPKLHFLIYTAQNI